MSPSTMPPPEKERYLMGFDIGGTGTKGGIVDLRHGRLVGERVRIPTPQPATPTAVAQGLRTLERVLAQTPEAPKVGAPAGAAFPAVIVQGVARSAANVDRRWIGTDVARLFATELSRPVHVCNDADAAGLAEAKYGAGRGRKGTILVLTLGTGIGSALIIDGKLVPNTELGHLELDGFDAEQRASAVARERDGVGWEDYALRLQRYLSHVEGLFSPDLFIIGGGISKRSQDFLPFVQVHTSMVTAALKNNAGIIGAALQARRNVKS